MTKTYDVAFIPDELWHRVEIISSVETGVGTNTGTAVRPKRKQAYRAVAGATMTGTLPGVLGSAEFGIRSAATTESVNQSTRSFDLPAGYQSGDLLFAVIGYRTGDEAIIVVPTGWTEIIQQGGWSTGDLGIKIWTRTSDGSEGSSVAIDNGATFRTFRMICLAIQNPNGIGNSANANRFSEVAGAATINVTTGSLVLRCHSSATSINIPLDDSWEVAFADERRLVVRAYTATATGATGIKNMVANASGSKGNVHIELLA